MAFLVLLPGCAGRPPHGPPSSLTLASFNVRILSTASRTDAELARIADVVQPYDLLAIQEVRDEPVLRRLVGLLGQRGLDYAYVLSPPVGRGVKERYAFLYRPDRVRPLTPGALYPDSDETFIREPFVTTFSAGSFDFTLVTIHVLFGSNLAQRRAELAALAGVYQAVQAQDPHEQDVILLGDFNAPPADPGCAPLRTLPTMTCVIAPPATTTITDTSLYDNFWFQRQYVREYAGEAGVDRFDETRFANDDSAAELAVSDHRPIWARFRLTGPDDD